jgi:MFS family permease
LGRLLFSVLYLPFSSRAQLLVAFFLTTVFLILGIVMSPWAFLVVGFLMGPCYPMSMALFRELFPRRLEQVTTACIVGSGLFIVVMHLSAGQITDLFGIRWAMALGPIFSLLALLMLLAYPFFWPQVDRVNDERSRS